MEIILDTNFILSAVKNKLDFMDAEKYGFLVLPQEVIKEIRKIKEKGEKRERDVSSLALKIIEKSERIKRIKLGNKNVDKGIIDYADRRKVIVATLDKELKKKLRGKARIITIRARKKLELV